MKAPKIRFKGESSRIEKFIKQIWKISTGKSNTQDQAEDWKYPFFIRSDIALKSNKFLFDEEAVITIGDWNIWKVFHYINGKYDLHQRCYKISDFKDIFWKYFYYYFSTKFYKRAMSMTAKATVDSVRLEMISDMLIRFPSLSEQEKIWSLFEQLDSHISKNQQKLEKLKNMKQSFLQKLFPKDWSALPELRFKGFEGAWEERKLGEIWSILTWSTPSTSIKNNYSENWMLRVTPTDIKNNTIKETAKKLSFDWQQIARIVPKYSILVTCIASIWKNTMLLAEWSFNQQINALVPNPERTNSYFLLSESEIRSNKMKNRASSWTMQIVNKSEFSNISTFIPSLPEQEKIWAFFEKLDTQITQQSQKIQKIQNIKQSLLEKMFI